MTDLECRLRHPTDRVRLAAVLSDVRGHPPNAFEQVCWSAVCPLSPLSPPGVLVEDGAGLGVVEAEACGRAVTTVVLYPRAVRLSRTG